MGVFAIYNYLTVPDSYQTENNMPSVSPSQMYWIIDDTFMTLYMVLPITFLCLLEVIKKKLESQKQTTLTLIYNKAQN
jgi:hypothetical protein